MNRRKILKNMIAGALSAKVVIARAADVPDSGWEIPGDGTSGFQSRWHLLPNMPWTGEDCWAQRLQDWYVRDGALVCLAHGKDRTVSLLTHQLSDHNTGFSAEMVFRFLNPRGEQEAREDYAGLRLGIQGRFDDYRSAIFTGSGMAAGITRHGRLFVGDQFAEKIIDEKYLTGPLKLILNVTPVEGSHSVAEWKVLDTHGTTLSEMRSSAMEAGAWKGNVAIASHFAPGKEANLPTIAVSRLTVSGKQVDHHPHQVFGPIYFAQYTLHQQVLKLTAQLAPMDQAGATATLQVYRQNQWQDIANASIHPLARTAGFRVEKWEAHQAVPYRVSYSLPMANGIKQTYTYEGSIAADPVKNQKVKALGFSCNWDYGFPDQEVVAHASKLNADLVFFLGDQFYEPNGGFGVQTSPIDKSSLDYLRKWYMFGWSYRDLFRHIPMAALPDDHDVYHGNIWGSGGRPTPPTGSDAFKQDGGGYKMPAEWVNMAQITQTSHMPDPFDPTPAQQGITVYYTTWNYAGISFAIIEDRKFKSAPKAVLPEEAAVYNGFSDNPAYDISKVQALEAQLLGERQMRFLGQWLADNNPFTDFKVLVSATPFCCLQTLPKAERLGALMTPSLPIPPKGEYLQGDMLVQDMDSNGWPQNRRNEVVKLLDKKVDLHLVGDQHLPSIVQYGADAYGDGCFCFAVPALNNLWPRRWYPPLDDRHQPLPGKAKFTGNFQDGFGNRITVYAAANPHQTGRQPATLYDRSTGYGLVEFDKAKDTISLHCFPRYADPTATPNDQYEGWPLTLDKNRKAKG